MNTIENIEVLKSAVSVLVAIPAVAFTLWALARRALA